MAPRTQLVLEGSGLRESASHPGLCGSELISRAVFSFQDRVSREGVSNQHALRTGLFGEKINGETWEERENGGEGGCGRPEAPNFTWLLCVLQDPSSRRSLRLFIIKRLRPVVLVCSKADFRYIREKSPDFTCWSSPRERWFPERDELPLGSGVHQGLQI